MTIGFVVSVCYLLSWIVPLKEHVQYLAMHLAICIPLFLFGLFLSFGPVPVWDYMLFPLFNFNLFFLAHIRLFLNWFLCFYPFLSFRPPFLYGLPCSCLLGSIWLFSSVVLCSFPATSCWLEAVHVIFEMINDIHFSYFQFVFKEIYICHDADFHSTFVIFVFFFIWENIC